MAFDVPPDNEPAKKPPWRPSKYDPAMCARAVEVGSIGGSQEEIAVELGVCVQTIHTWQAQHPDFLEAMTRAKMLEMVWWERKGRNSLDADRFQASVWSRSMAARFPNKWREKTAVVGGDKDDNPIKQEHTHRNLDEVVGRIAGLAARIGTTRNPEGSDGS